MTAGCSCGRRWTSLTQAHCPLCHRHFASVALADKHHTYDEVRRATCHDPATVRTPKADRRVFRASDELGGVVWRSYATDNRWSVHPCGHRQVTAGCGGCDPGAIESVVDVDGRLEPFNPAWHMQDGAT